ncbi:MAG: hypothetical protein FWB99_10580, partial [Treponema sp.]|nr:hypothetical protein [Treponema sp.]
MTEKPITTEQEAWAAVKKDCMNFKHVPDRLKTHDMCIQSVLWGSRGIMLFWYVPDRLKTADMCCYAVGREGILRWYVPKKFLTVDMLLEAGNDYGYTLNELLSLLLDGREIAGVINRLAARFPPQPFELIRRAAAPRLLRLVRQEAPQTVAVILANIESDKAAYLLQNLPHDTQADIARRIAAMENPSRETLRDLSQELREDEPGDSDSRESEGQADKDTGNRKKRIFLFEDIVMLKDRCIQKVIRELDQRELAKALEGSEKDVQDKIFRNISKRAAVMFKEDMEWLGPIGPELAKEAQE